MKLADNQFIISIHALRGEGDDASRNTVRQRRYFNPRPPWGGRRAETEQRGIIGFISIHALRGEGDEEHGDNGGADLTISIHALRGEGDISPAFKV